MILKKAKQKCQQPPPLKPKKLLLKPKYMKRGKQDCLNTLEDLWLLVFPSSFPQVNEKAL